MPVVTLLGGCCCEREEDDPFWLSDNWLLPRATSFGLSMLVSTLSIIDMTSAEKSLLLVSAANISRLTDDDVGLLASGGRSCNRLPKRTLAEVTGGRTGSDFSDVIDMYWSLSCISRIVFLVRGMSQNDPPVSDDREGVVEPPVSMKDVLDTNRGVLDWLPGLLPSMESSIGVRISSTSGVPAVVAETLLHPFR